MARRFPYSPIEQGRRKLYKSVGFRPASYQVFVDTPSHGVVWSGSSLAEGRRVWRQWADRFSPGGTEVVLERSDRPRKHVLANTGTWERGRRTRAHGNRSTGGGYHVMTWGGGRYTAIAWYPTKAQAERDVARIRQAGAWHGKPPKIEQGRELGWGSRTRGR